MSTPIPDLATLGRAHRQRLDARANARKGLDKWLAAHADMEASDLKAMLEGAVAKVRERSEAPWKAERKQARAAALRGDK